MHGTLNGLSAEEAAARLAADGANLLPQPPRRSLLRRLTGELVHFFALMLWVAGGLALLAGMPQLGIAIFAVILINAAFALAQEARADPAAAKLHSMLPTRVTVRRDGRRQIVDAAEIVVDDLLLSCSVTRARRRPAGRWRCSAPLWYSPVDWLYKRARARRQLG